MSPLDFSVEELDQLMDLANDIEKNPEKYAHACDGKRLATLFYDIFFQIHQQCKYCKVINRLPIHYKKQSGNQRSFKVCRTI